MMAPLEAIMNALPHLAQANVALKHIGALELSLQSSAQTIEHTGAWILAGLPEIHLRLDGIGYAYHDRSDARQFTLGPIDMTLRSGEILFITGGNGSGKTTLVKLISGLYAPQHGHISLNGRRINSHNLENYRQLFSAVFNDSYLFDSLPVPDGSNLDEQARFYLKLLELDQKLKIENGKFSTTALSQGQRKRLTLLTALLEDRPIYVFDEWAADQDPRFKHLFYDLILPRLKARNKAVLVITHDDRYFDWADRILKLEEGKPAETVELIVSAETASPSGIRSCA
jgi:putative ATP-binding cassette transporter